MLYRLLSWLPFPVLYATAQIAYLLLYYVAGYRKAVVRENLGKAFPEKNEKEITVLAKKFYLQLAQVALEIVKARRMNKADFRQRVKIVNPELMQRCSNDYQDSVILLTIHQGNWEWMLHGVTCAMNIPIDPVYKPLHNKTVDRLIFDIRSQFGSRPLSMARATRDILRRRREFRVFVMVADQSPVRRERSYWTEFMNQQAAVYTGAETIAKMTQFPVLFAQCRRRSRGHYELEFHELARPPYDKDSHAITDSYVRMAEQAIRSEPQSWLWSNRRWKRDLAQESKKHVT
ncbi:MAG: lipid A biosynthesis (KDO)2-(lauroyl)-lipid IVA acyltransferase [Gammaproteobacteria bacterium]|nr:MAG: lipid A biosynthesis (KDO)2-(lauroyl)-lipid IVA acyltransferase [Gammaproteobacteria bacterium]